MTKNLIKDEIRLILEALAEQHTTICQHEKKIPQIELDIVLANIRNLYDRYVDLDKLNKKPTEFEKKISPEIESGNVIIKQDSNKKNIQEIIIQEKKVLPDKDISEDSKNYSTERGNISHRHEVNKKTKTDKRKGEDLFSMSDKETLADKYKESSPSLNEKLFSEKTDKTVAEKIGKVSIQNLKSAIGINDKFLFINELFRGDLQLYNKTIDTINSFTSIEDTTVYLEEIKTNLGWEEGSETYQKLEELVIRKFL
ncbi:MAG: hypothetical protein PHR81_00135 [Bacteroidales bacterium]|jgi:hypothetical protein|nr:hypothetical protein [Bacteroidales bacterium]MDD4213194.1 hypothetical protein [Bacteroidales bacterium]